MNARRQHPRTHSNAQESHYDLHSYRSQAPRPNHPDTPPKKRNNSSAAQSTSTNTDLGMSPASRYNHNIKVLRRHDPSIVSIFDQFSHVCLYHHNGSKWEKKGFEGSMFLYERKTEPRYGFFILNRMGMDDYIQRMSADDDMEVHGNYLMYRCYPELARRREDEGLDGPVDPNSPDKGEPETVGLWMFATDAREPMSDVMMRLHGYIKKNIHYPDEFRYGPNHPPPPNPHPNPQIAASMRKDGHSYDSNSSSVPVRPMREDTSRGGGHGHPKVNGSTGQKTRQDQSASGSASELDRLFSKLMPESGDADSSTSPSPVLRHQAPVQSSSTRSVQDLFTSINGDITATTTTTTTKLHITHPHQPHVQTHRIAPAAVAPPPNRGIALLDTIFASASTPPRALSSVSASSSKLTPSSSYRAPEIHSPTPTSTALPAILTQDVISGLLGNSGSSSSGSSSPHARRRSGSSYEGSVGSSASPSGGDEFSESSTVLDGEPDPDLDMDGINMPPFIAVPESDSQDTILGDVTPRPGSRGAAAGTSTNRWPRTSTPPPAELSPSRSRTHGRQYLSASPRASTFSFPLSRADPTSHPSAPVPITPVSSSLNAPQPSSRPPAWGFGYPLDDRSLEVDDDAEVVVLDFEDTSALSDPGVFSAKVKAKRENNAVVEGNLNSVLSVQGSEPQESGKAGSSKTRRGLRKKSQNNKDGEGSAHVDVPPPTIQTQSAPTTQLSKKDTSKGKQPPQPEAQLPRIKQPEELAGATGKVHVNGAGRLDRETARASILHATERRTTVSAGLPNGLQRNEFVREILTLIHTDKCFVDEMWKDYVEHAN